MQHCPHRRSPPSSDHPKLPSLPPTTPLETLLIGLSISKLPSRRQTIEVRISHDEFVVVSFPGPDRSIRLEDLQAGRAVSRRYRNRRIGEFLKELDLTEGRSTGIPKILKVMAANGSPAPLFESDDDRLWFVIRLPSHPLAMAGITPTDQATGEVTGEVARLLRAMDGAMSRQQIQEALALKHEDHFRNAYLKPALTLGVIADPARRTTQ